MDDLNQAGKQINRTFRRVDKGKSTYQRNFPLIERARDSVDCNHPFIMEIPVVPGQKTRINIIFLEPYYPNPCGGG